MFGAISNKDLEAVNDYFMQFIKFISYEKSEYLRPTIQLKNGSYLNLKNQLNLYIDQYL